MGSSTFFAMDGGHDRIKSAAPTGAIQEDFFPHLLARMDDTAYNRVTSRADSRDEDYFTVNGTHYVIGPKALRFNPDLGKEGASRYTDQYYGVLAAIAMARAFRKTKKNIFFVGSHAPGDVDYRENLMASVVRRWEVQWHDQSIILDVRDATTLDEPLGGYHNVVVRKDGKGYNNREVDSGVTLVLDIGAYTTDGIVIDPGGDIDYTTALSTKIGVHKSVEAFLKNFRSDHRNLLMGNDVTVQQAQDAIRTGVFNLRGLGKVDCAQQAQEVRNELVEQVANFYSTYGGASQYDALILTGGGSALLGTELKSKIKHNNILFADNDLNTLHMANVRGIVRWYRMHEMLGTFE